MKKIQMKKILSTVVAVTVVLSVTCSSYAIEIKPHVEEYKINTLDELKNTLNRYDSDGMPSKIDAKIVNEISPKIIEKYLGEKTEKAVTEMNKIEPDSIMKSMGDGAYRGEKRIDLGDGSIAIVEFEDAEEETIFSSVKDFLIPRAYAATNGETMWKKYGNRYFTAKATILSGIGGCVCRLENHYTLSAKGIDERYGDAYEVIGFSVGIHGTVNHDSVIITDKSARTPGASDVNMYVRFGYNYSALDAATVQGSCKLSTTVAFMDIDKTDKKIKVKHSWKSEHSKL